MIASFVMKALFWFTGIVVCLAAGVLGTMVADRDPPIETHSATVTNPEVLPGEMLVIRYKVNRTRSCFVQFSRTLRDSASPVHRVVLPDMIRYPGADPLGEDTYVSVVPIPENFSPGPAVYSTVALYQCNIVHALWPIVTPPRDLHFRVQKLPG